MASENFISHVVPPVNYKTPLNINNLSQESKKPILSSYTDFRMYLKDVYEFRRKTERTGFRSYNYSHFSASADIKSPNYLKLIIEGKRNLSEDMIVKFAKALRLDKEEFIEFRVLVLYGQASDSLERNRYLKELSDLRAHKALHNLTNQQSAWLDRLNWISWVIYAMADQSNIQLTAENITKHFRSQLSLSDVREALDKLIKSGRFKIDEVTGEIQKNSVQSELQQEIPAEYIRAIQGELIYLGIESLLRDSPKEREFGGLTISLTHEEFDQIRFELRQLRKRIQKDIGVKRSAQKGDQVYQLNIQFFPVTNPAQD